VAVSYDYELFCALVADLDGTSCFLADLLRQRQRRYPHDYSPGLLTCDGIMDCHHLIRKNRLKQERRLIEASGRALEKVLEDPRNGVLVCRRHHDLLERALVVLRREELPVRVFEFASELGLEGWLERYYLPQAA
jgi:hypothetical protein